MKLIGLTGGIATGKSTVSRMLVDAGLPLIDADVVAREVVAPGTPGLSAVSERFAGVVTPEGLLDRKALATRVFGDANERAALNAIVHPLVSAAVIEKTQALAAQGTPLAIYDAPLLIENALYEGLDGVILVATRPEVQKARLMTRDGLSEAEAEARMRSQLPIDAKRPYARWVIDNNGPVAVTRAQVEQVLAELNDLHHL